MHNINYNIVNIPIMVQELGDTVDYWITESLGGGGQVLDIESLFKTPNGDPVEHFTATLFAPGSSNEPNHGYKAVIKIKDGKWDLINTKEGYMIDLGALTINNTRAFMSQSQMNGVLRLLVGGLGDKSPV